MPTRADGLKSLEAFLAGTRTVRATFTQTVQSPAKDGQAPRVRTSQGRFELSRPGRLRFVYQKPFEQVLVADGKQLWLFDVDLNQVTVRDQAQALASTPAALLVLEGDRAALQRDFQLSALSSNAEGLAWVQALPRASDSSLQSVRLGFRGADLVALDMNDSFGQVSALRFAALERNVALPSTSFVFTPPAGVDVLRP